MRDCCAAVCHLITAWLGSACNANRAVYRADAAEAAKPGLNQGVHLSLARKPCRLGSETHFLVLLLPDPDFEWSIIAPLLPNRPRGVHGWTIDGC